MDFDISITVPEFKTAIEFERANQSAMEHRLMKYFLAINSYRANDPNHTMHLVRSALQNKQQFLLQLPFANHQIDFLYFHGDNNQYTVINSAQPRISENAFLCRALCYKLAFAANEQRSDARLFFGSQTYTDSENMKNAAFANMLLLPAPLFQTMFRQFQAEQQPEDSTLSVLVRLMNYFKAPYHAVLTRCYSLGLLSDGSVLEQLLRVDSSLIAREFRRLWLDESLLRPTMQDDFSRFEQHVKTSGEQYVAEEYLKLRTLNLALANMKTAYLSIREG